MNDPSATGTGRAWSQRVARRQVSAEEGIARTLARIERLDPQIRSFLHVDADASLLAARRLDASIAAGETPGPLAGLPVAVKDNIAVAGMPLTCASRLLGRYRPGHESTAVARLRSAGAIIIGKTNLDEFAMGSSTENSAYQVTRNPWAPQRSPGGSSGGSAAAVAAELVPVALGSDTGGSIRQPASMCGLAGIKPSYGRVSRWGLVAHASSLDQIGPLALDLQDAWMILRVISGHDRQDPTTLSAALLHERPEPVDARRLIVGRPHEWLYGSLHPEVASAMDSAYSRLSDAGARVVDLRLPSTEAAVSAYYIISSCEAASNLARYDGLRYGRRAPGATWQASLCTARQRWLGQEVRRRIMIGTFALSHDYRGSFYLNAARVRRQIRDEFTRAFADVDVIVGPVCPTPAFPLGEKLTDPLQMYLCDIFTVSASLAGLPAVTLPWACTPDRLPIGLQIIAPAQREDLAVAVGISCQRLAPTREPRPAPGDLDDPGD